MIELLITESFSGVDYDFSFPCPDCYDNRSIDSEMSMFSASLVRRATQARAVFLQCRNQFHVTPMTDLHSRMPPDSVDAYDMQLYGSVRELKHLKYIKSILLFNNYKFTILFQQLIQYCYNYLSGKSSSTTWLFYIRRKSQALYILAKYESIWRSRRTCAVGSVNDPMKPPWIQCQCTFEMPD